MPSTRLCVFGCNTIGVTIHNFPNPAKFPEKFKVWVNLVGQALHGLSDDDIYKRKKVCDIHFTEQDRNRNSRLNALAVPTMHLPSAPISNPTVENIPAVQPQMASSSDSARSLSPPPKRKWRRSGETNSIAAFSPMTLSKNSSRENIPSPQPFDDDTIKEADNVDKETEECQFSWQKANQICIDDKDEEWVTTHTKEWEVTEDEQSKNKYSENQKEYICDSCCGKIARFRYTCVQCENYDLCHVCETKNMHPHHYMLRVPKPRPFSEIQGILEAIRNKIRSWSKELDENCIEFEEIKLEQDFEVPTAIDPLSCTPRVQTPDIASHITQNIKTHVVSDSPMDIVTSHKAMDALTTSIEESNGLQYRETHIATSLMKIPLATSHKNRPAALQKKKLKPALKDTGPFGQLKDTCASEIQPENVPVMINPTVHLKKLKLIKDIENRNDSNTTLATHGEDFEQLQYMEETWLDEDILEEEISEEYEEVLEESSSPP